MVDRYTEAGDNEVFYNHNRLSGVEVTWKKKETSLAIQLQSILYSYTYMNLVNFLSPSLFFPFFINRTFIYFSEDKKVNRVNLPGLLST